MYSSVKTNRTKQNKKLWVIMLQVNMLKIGKKKKNKLIFSTCQQRTVLKE